jgi:hypothetical protein
MELIIQRCWKDSPTTVTKDPKPTEEEIDWILKEVGNYLGEGIFFCFLGVSRNHLIYFRAKYSPRGRTGSMVRHQTIGPRSSCIQHCCTCSKSYVEC